MRLCEKTATEHVILYPNYTITHALPRKFRPKYFGFKMVLVGYPGELTLPPNSSN